MDRSLDHNSCESDWVHSYRMLLTIYTAGIRRQLVRENGAEVDRECPRVGPDGNSVIVLVPLH